MSPMDPGQDRSTGGDPPWADDVEPEPAWAEEIRRGRRERGRRLREIFATFGEPEASGRDGAPSDEDEPS